MENENKIDTRKLSPEAQEEKRKLVIKLRKKNIPNQEIAQIVEMNSSVTSTIWNKYLASGSKTLKSQTRGRKLGDQRKLTITQEKQIISIITDKYPDQIKLPFALWTREAVKQLIERETKVIIAINTVGDYLKRWGFTPQKPVKRAYEQQPAQVKKWLDETYPEIAKEAKQENAEIYWGDETGVQNNANVMKGYSPKGKKPIINLNVNKCRINMISAISNEGHARFMVYTENMNSDRLIEFMKRLIEDAKRKVYLILDNLPVHHSKPVMQWVEENATNLRVFYLPSYSPEYNPDEYLNNDLKLSVHSGIPARTEKQLTDKTLSFMRSLETSFKAKYYFNHEKVAYAA